MLYHLGILGGGNISRTHLRAAQQVKGVRVTAVCGENRAKVEELARQAGATPYTDLEEFLDHRPLDLVAIGSPSGLHARQGMEAARRKLHVLVEKPIDISRHRADELIACCRQEGVKLGVFFQDRVAADLVRLKTLIEEGRLGRVLLASAQVPWYRPPEYYGDSRWRGTWELDGGGALMNQGIHTVDLLLWLLGPVGRVYAQTRTSLHRIEAEDTAVAILEFTSGALATLEAATCVFPGYPRRLRLSGTEGTALVEENLLTALDLRVSGEPGSSPASSRPPQAGRAALDDVAGHQRLLQDFLNAIREDRPPLCDGVEARQSVALVEAMYESARRRQPVEPASF